MKSRKRVLYGEANYKSIVEKNGYYVDKTEYIRLLEDHENAVFLRPRRFGKSLLCTTLQYYYDINYKDQFEELFGHTAIGKTPTFHHNRFLVLHLDFSVIEISGDLAEIEASFNAHCNRELHRFVHINRSFFGDSIQIERGHSAAANLDEVLISIKTLDLPQVYLIIDEYDNFANRLITSNQDRLYRELTADNGFLKNFFKVLKKGAKDQTLFNTFITGVLPITMDDLASGYNIAKYLTLRKNFEGMLGFTQAEVDHLLDQVYADYDIDLSSRREVGDVIKSHYNGYHFVDPEGESLYNSTILLFFLEQFCAEKTIPEFLTDMNLKTDISWVKRLTGSNPELTEELVDQLTLENQITFNKKILTEKFNMSQFFKKGFFPVSFFYLGMFTRKDEFSLCLPNLNMRGIFVEYFNELHQIDVASRYADMMSNFVNRPDLPKLFADFWSLYISQFPESIFQKVNENFYRSTFYALCSDFLSNLFTFNIERSYPSGRSDLEFVGKFGSAFAGVRYILEFKYVSNADAKKKGISIDQFELVANDQEQVKKYETDLLQEYPETQVSCFVVYCFGNQGFRVFSV